MAQKNQDTVKIEIEVPKDSISIKEATSSDDRKVIEAQVVKATENTAKSEEESPGFTNPKLIKIPTEDTITHQSSGKTSEWQRLVIICGFIVVVLGFFVMIISFGIGLVISIFGALVIASAILLKL